MAKADTSVKWFHSGMADAVQQNGAAGNLIQILDSCLVDGFSTRTPDSISVSGGVATVSISAGNPYEKHAVITIGGASDVALNSEWKIDTSAASSFTFLCPGVADGTVSGASIKRAGGGWGKPFSGTNKAAYQSANLNSTQLYLRVDDGYSTYALVRGYENMTGVDTGTGPFPTFTQLSELNWRIPKASGLDWTVITDGQFAWILVTANSNTVYARLMHCFGDIVPLLQSDKYHCLMAATEGVSTFGTNNAGGNASGAARAFARGHSQVGGAIYNESAAVFSGTTTWTGAIPENNAIDGGVRLGGEIYISTGTVAAQLRGKIPGARSSLEKIVGNDLAIFEVDGEVLLCVYTSTGGSAKTIALFDIKGPWR